MRKYQLPENYVNIWIGNHIINGDVVTELNCYLCGSVHNTMRPGSVRDDSTIKVYECDDCSLVFLSSLEHIKKGHYEESGMHDAEPDIPAWLKETHSDDERRYHFMKAQMTNKSILDFGCGIGGFLDYAKQSALKIAGIELENALQPSFRERGLNVFSNLQDALEDGNRWNLITAFHVIEHLSDPRTILKELSTLLEKEGRLIIEVPSSDDALLTIYKSKPFQDFTYWSQHLFLFNAKTLKDLVKQAGLKINWIKHIQRYPLSNHLYWLANGKAGGHQKWGFMNNQRLNAEYESQLAALGKTDTIIAEISK
jgi:2-polyprenyl-3-methyl-5-hydroxy-6-metoxy-1,4-benzoquinol methylase